MRAEYPAFVRLYDILFAGARDLRDHSWQDRRRQLEAIVQQFPANRFALSQLVEVDKLKELDALSAEMRDTAMEGVILKRRDSPYVAGRRVVYWYKWKRDPLVADCV